MGSGTSSNRTTVTTPESRGRPLSAAPGRDQRGSAQGSAKPARPKTAGIRDNVLHNKFQLTRQKTFAHEYADNKTVVAEILKGNPSYNLKNEQRIVRIFTSSTFTDTKYERNTLMENVYPKLKLFCQEHGYEFQVVDMRWGVREEAENDHMSTELCMKELLACKEVSTGPNFVTFLSHKYGYRPFPRRIEARIFETVTQGAKGNELLSRWFKRDDNAVPAEYVLQPISSEFPDFLSQDREEMKKAKEKWWKVFESLQETLVSGAKKYLTDPEETHDFLKSVTEREIELGILEAEDPGKHCLWFKRMFKNIETVSPSRTLSRYYECLGADEYVTEVRGLLKKLADDKLSAALQSENVVEYEIDWTEKGVNPENIEHESYLQQLSRDFEMRIKDMISQGIKQRTLYNSDDKLYLEVSQHTVFCKNKEQQFSGRADIIKNVQRYISTSKSNLPLVIQGESGCGKTCLMAEVATQAWTWTNKSAAIIYRFIGTTGESSSICSMLTSINQQLCRVKNLEHHLSGNFCNSGDYKSVAQGFGYLLTAQSKSSVKDIVLVIDSLDQLDNSDNGKNLEWIPQPLPPNIKLVMSTLPQEKYGTLTRCQALFPNQQCYIELGHLPAAEIDGILKKWLNMKERTLTPAQTSLIKGAYMQCQYPLFLKLSFDEALRWHSYDPASKNKLQASIITSINVLFERLEKQHGRLMVVFALSYLTLSKHGLTEGEMEDLLSLCDPVLNDTYQYWTPPIRRLPPLLWVRIKNELQEYLVTRGVDGVQVINWYHRQFIETASARYLDNKDFVYRCHSDMSQFYLGIWAENEKPYQNKKGQAHSAFRFVSRQPLMFDNGSYNLRKLNQLPHHLLLAREFNVLKDEVLCNYEFLLARISALGIGSVLNLLKDAQMLSPKDEEVAIMIETLQLSQNAISKNSNELAGQLIGRIRMHESATEMVVNRAKRLLAAKAFDTQTTVMVEQLIGMIGNMEGVKDEKYPRLVSILEQCKESSQPVLIPNGPCLLPPGGQLLHKLGHLESVNDLDINSIGTIIATGADDNTVKFWKVETGEEIHTLELESDVVSVRFSPDDKFVVASTVMGKFYLLDIQQKTIASKSHETTTKESFGPRRFSFAQPKDAKMYLVAVNGPNLEFYDVPSLKHVLSSATGLGHENNSNKVFDTYGHLVACSSKVKGTVFLYSLANGLEKMTKNDIKLFADPESASSPNVANLIFANNGAMLIIQDGYGQGLYCYHTDSCIKTNAIKGFPQKKKSSLYFSVKNMFLYSAIDKEVEITNMETMEVRKYFSHPCKVRKAVSRDGRHVVTLGEDSVLRVWDQTIRPMSADVSAFSGKVTAQSDQSMQMMQTVIDSFKEVFGAEAMEADDILTTKDVGNYWTKNIDNPPENEIISKHITIGNGRYFIVVHNTVSQDSNQAYSHCFTVWDLKTMQCMRRTFLRPSRILIFGGNNDEVLFASITHERPQQTPVLHKLSLTNYETSAIGTGSNPFVWETLQTIKENNVILGQFTHSNKELHSFDIASGRFCVCYTVKAAQKATSARPTTAKSVSGKPNIAFTAVQVLPEIDRVVCIWNHKYLCIWKLKSADSVAEIDLKGLIKGEDTVINVAVTQDSGFVVVAVDDSEVSISLESSLQTLVVSLTTGLETFREFLPLHHGTVTDQGSSQAVLIRRGFPGYMQSVAISRKGQVTSVKSVAISRHTNRLKQTDDLKRCVTWCDDGTDQTVQFWQTQFNTADLLGSFTLDEKVDDVTIVDGGKNVILNSATGLVSLCLQGRKVYQTASSLSGEAELFDTQALDVWISTP